MKIGIVGAGVAGVAVAWSLTRIGARVTLFDRLATPGAGLTSFSWMRRRGGTSSTSAFLRNPNLADKPQALLSQEALLGLRRDLEAACPAPSAKKVLNLEGAESLRQGQLKEARRLDTGGRTESIWLQSASEACRALLASSLKNCVEMSLSNEVRALLSDSKGRVRGLCTEHGDYEFDAVVICSGAEVPDMVTDLLLPRPFPARRGWLEQVRAPREMASRPKHAAVFSSGGLRMVWGDQEVWAEAVQSRRAWPLFGRRNELERFLHDSACLDAENWRQVRWMRAACLIPNSTRPLSGPLLGRRVWIHCGVDETWETVVLRGHAVALNMLGRSCEVAPECLSTF